MPGFNEGILGPMTTTALQKGYIRSSAGLSSSDSPSFAGLTLTGLLSGVNATFNGIVSAYNGSDYISMVAGTDSYIFAQKGGVNYAIGFKVGGPYYDASSGTVTTKTLSGTNQITLANSFDTIQGRLSGGGVGIIDVRADNGFRVRNLANSADTSLSAGTGMFSGQLSANNLDLAPGRLIIRCATLSNDQAAGIALTSYSGNLVEIRNSTNAQTLRVYGSYTDVTTYSRASLSCSTTALTLAFESNTGNGDVILTPKGTGGVFTSAANTTVSDPRVFGISDLNVNCSARFQIGDHYNAIATTSGTGMTVRSYHTLDLQGDHRASYQAPQASGVGIGVLVRNITAATKALVVRSATSQSGNLFECQGVGLNLLARINAAGELLATNGLTALKGTSYAVVTIAGGSNEFMQVGPANTTITTASYGLGALNGTLGPYMSSIFSTNNMVHYLANDVRTFEVASKKTMVYDSYTDASTYVRASLSCSTTAVTLAAESAGGGANLNIILTPKGTGGVGIGTTGPVAPLQVIGKVLLGSYPTNSDAYHEFSSGAGFAVTTNSYNDRYLWYSNSGNFEVINPEGVGTSRYFRIGAGYSNLGLLAGGSPMNLMCDNGASSNIYFQTKNTGDAVPITRMTVLSAGNVGIGETAPDYKLDVNGTFGFTPGASVTPIDNGDVVIEATNNTTLTFKLKGSDGVVRTGTITLA